MVTSFRLAEAGAALLLASVLSMLFALPRLAPLELGHCTYAGCFSSVNPLYPLAFLLSVAGTIILFVGAFGGRFVLTPVFVAGLVALEYGLASAFSAFWRSGQGSAVSPELFAPLIFIGGLAIGFHTLRHLRTRRQAV
ncbi:MAG TPA: hypothetical protein VLY65_02695 [Nitrososphaerales archaeon]|nr:hypothetical protein [Nitrososphaerales archaeon]